MDKLSRLQQMILVSLSSETFLVRSQRDRNMLLFKIWFGPTLEFIESFSEDSAEDKANQIRGALWVFRADLSRAYRRLEKRGMVRKANYLWFLNDKGKSTAALEVACNEDPNVKQALINRRRAAKRAAKRLLTQ